MSFGEDDDILQDFLVEAGEILDKLSEQLVDLEQRPDDRNLLNAIFRGFHTVKGGAGFLQLDAMVACCHITENLFDILRNGQRTVTPELMDVVLQALDTVNAQFAQTSAREVPVPASPQLIARLERLVSCEDLLDAPAPLAAAPSAPVAATSASATIVLSDDEFANLLDAVSADKPAAKATVAAQPAAPAPVPSPTAKSSASSEDISEDEFESLLDQLHGAGKSPSAAKPAPAVAPAPVVKPAVSAAPSNEISDSEFESLLDQLHGAGKGPANKSAAAKPVSVAGVSSGLITDDEFENLLDQLHGSGKGPATKLAAAPSAPVTAPKPEAPRTPAPMAAKAHPSAPAAPAVRAAPQRVEPPAEEAADFAQKKSGWRRQLRSKRSH